MGASWGFWGFEGSPVEESPVNPVISREMQGEDLRPPPLEGLLHGCAPAKQTCLW